MVRHTCAAASTPVTRRTPRNCTRSVVSVGVLRLHSRLASRRGYSAQDDILFGAGVDGRGTRPDIYNSAIPSSNVGYASRAKRSLFIRALSATAEVIPAFTISRVRGAVVLKSHAMISQLTPAV